MSRFTHLVLDVDSTLSSIEGIDWLARRRGGSVASEIVAMTAAAMRGDVPLESVYGRRLACIQPSREDIAALARAYVSAVSPGASDAIARVTAAGVHVMLVSGGLRDAVLPLADSVGIPPQDVHAVPLRFSDAGAYAGYDESSPLWRMGGKPALVATIAPRETTVAMGDGITDAELTSVVARFIAFTGVARHPRVVASAYAEIDRFADLPQHVLV